MSLARTIAVIQSAIERGMQFGLQIYVSRQGEVLLDTGFGIARPDVPMTRDTIMPWLSAGKPLTAVAVLMLVERGLLTLETRVTDVIPEFAAGGKHEIELRHLLTHTCGFRNAPLSWPNAEWNEMVATICSLPLEEGWVIGETSGYHVASSWYVLGELVRRIDGRFLSEFLRSEVFLPLGMSDSWNGMPSDVWQSYGDRIGLMWNRDRGETRELEWHDARHCQACSPGANSRGPVRELGRFYEHLLAVDGFAGQRLLSPAMVAEMTSRQRVGRFDQTLQHSMDFGWGFMIDSKHYGPKTVPYGFGARCSSRAFGHGGSQSSIAFADPLHGLVVAYVANVRPGEAWHQRRHRELVDAIWDDLEVAC